MRRIGPLPVRRAVILALCAAAPAGPAAAPAFAESEAVCRNYAQEAVAAQRQNLRRESCRLKGDMWSDNYGNHFNWCRRQPANVVAAEAKKRMDALTACTGQAALCERYAKEAVDAQRQNLRRDGCKLRGDMWSDNYGAHVAWCRGQSANAVAAESKKRLDALAECSGRPAHCRRYANAAVAAQNVNLSAAKCQKQGPRWSRVFNDHYNWCLGQPQSVSQREHDAREAEIKACSFESAPRPPGSLAGARVDGIELVRDGAAPNSTVTIVGNRTFLSQGTLCGQWQANRERLDKFIESQARGKGYKGFNVRSDVDSKVTGSCTAVSRMAGGGITVQIALPRNVVFFYLTTPGPLPGWTDPKFSITYDAEATLHIRIPTNAGQPFRVEASARIFNLRPDSHNVTGDAARAVASVVDYFSGGAISRMIPQEVPFKAETERSLGPIARAVPPGHRLDQRPGSPNLLILHATRRAPAPGPR